MCTSSLGDRCACYHVERKDVTYIIRCLPQRNEDEEWKEGEDEEQEAGNGSRGGLLHDDREEEGEHDDGDAVVDHEEQDEAGVALGQEAAEAEDHGDEQGVDQDDEEQHQEV